MLRTTLSVPALIVLFLSAVFVRADAPQGDKDLDGEWETKSRPNDDNQPADAPKPSLSVKGDVLTIKFGDDVTRAKIKVDPSKTPRAIDLTPEDGPQQGQTMKGIYEVKGEELRFYYAEVGKDRPTDFPSKGGVAVWKRVKK